MLKSRALDLILETYIVENVAVISPDEDLNGSVWVPFKVFIDATDVSVGLAVTDTPVEANEEKPVKVGIANDAELRD